MKSDGRYDKRRRAHARRGARALAAALAAVTLALAASACAASAPGAATSSSPSPSPTLSAAHITITPKNGLRQAKPQRGITVTVRDGTLTSVTARSGSDTVAGKLDSTSTTWQSKWALSTGKQYVVRATAVDADGRSITKMSRFRTLVPGTTASVQIFEGHNVTYGVGMPVMLSFSKPVEDSPGPPIRNTRRDESRAARGWPGGVVAGVLQSAAWGSLSANRVHRQNVFQRRAMLDDRRTSVNGCATPGTRCHLASDRADGKMPAVATPSVQRSKES